jgi:poly(3-hydroxybutyrate) depolymerase
MRRSLSLFFLAVVAVCAQPRIEQNRQSLELSAVTLITQFNLAAAGESKQAAGALMPEVRKLITSGRTGEARRTMARIRTALAGQQWNAKEEFCSSLVLRAPAVADPSRPLYVTLSQVYPAFYDAKQGMRLRAGLHELRISGRRMEAGKLVRDFGVLEALGPDLIEEPFSFDVDLSGVPDGNYVLLAAPMDFYDEMVEVGMRIAVVNGFDAARTDIEARLKKISGRDSAKASVRAPFDLARQINAGRREFQAVDFAAQIARSRQILASLESGRDPLYRAKGNQLRHYYFAEPDEIMPYRVYVPSTYDGKTQLPLVLALHGLGGNENSLMDRDDKLLASLAEKYGFLVAAPLGYRPNGAYGNSTGSENYPRRRVLSLSEQDTMNVLDLVLKEYNADPNRVFLMGHSMGGGGTWFLGAKEAGRWKGLAPIAAPAVTPERYPFAKLKGTALFVAHGDADPTVPVAASRTMVEKARAAGVELEYFESPGTDHSDIVTLALPRIFEFFAKAAR